MNANIIILGGNIMIEIKISKNNEFAWILRETNFEELDNGYLLLLMEV